MQSVFLGSEVFIHANVDFITTLAMHLSLLGSLYAFNLNVFGDVTFGESSDFTTSQSLLSGLKSDSLRAITTSPCVFSVKTPLAKILMI